MPDPISWSGTGTVPVPDFVDVSVGVLVGGKLPELPVFSGFIALVSESSSGTVPVPFRSAPVPFSSVPVRFRPASGTLPVPLLGGAIGSSSTIFRLRWISLWYLGSLFAGYA